VTIAARAAFAQRNTLFQVKVLRERQATGAGCSIQPHPPRRPEHRAWHGLTKGKITARHRDGAHSFGVGRCNSEAYCTIRAEPATPKQTMFDSGPTGILIPSNPRR
jgi:hypothetical protein